MLHFVKNLSPEERHAAEILLGRPVSDGEAISIKGLDTSTIIPAALSPEERIAALRAMEEHFTARRVGDVSIEEEDALVREAFAATRKDHGHSR